MRCLLVIVLTLFFIHPALADCTGPAGAESATRYDFTAHKLYYCNGADWVDLGGASGGVVDGGGGGSGALAAVSATLTGNVNNWSPPGAESAELIEVSSSVANVQVTGLLIPGQATNREIYIRNVGTNAIRLYGNSSSSASGNRFMGWGSYQNLTAGKYVRLKHNGTTGWIFSTTVGGVQTWTACPAGSDGTIVSGNLSVGGCSNSMNLSQCIRGIVQQTFVHDYNGC